jgi:hypothetical protein
VPLNRSFVVRDVGANLTVVGDERHPQAAKGVARRSVDGGRATVAGSRNKPNRIPSDVTRDIPVPPRTRLDDC